jgi:hypothetical protein
MVPPEKQDVSSRQNLAAVQPDQDDWAGLIARTAQGDETASQGGCLLMIVESPA